MSWKNPLYPTISDAVPAQSAPTPEPCRLCNGNGWFYAWPSPDKIPCHRCAIPPTSAPERGTRAKAKMKAFPNTWTAWDDGWSHAYGEMFESFHRCGLLTEDYDEDGSSAVDAIKARFAHLEAALTLAREALLSGEQMDGLGEWYKLDGAKVIAALNAVRAATKEP